MEDIVKTYTIKNDKLNGLTTFYDDEKPIATLEYKNDLPFEGTLLEKRSFTIFKNGQMLSENIYRSDHNKTIAKTKMYENGVLSKVIDHSFVIPEDPQESYETTFKNGKPFSGYYINDEDSEFKNVVFYENGLPKFQYSNDYLENMDNYEYQAYNIKSTFKNGKIYDGVEYISGKKFLVLKYWKNGVLQSFDLDMFAVNYFNRIHFELKGNDINIEDLQEKTKAIIRIENIGNTVSQKLLLNNEVIFSSTIPSLEKISVQKDHHVIVLYEEENGKITSRTIDIAIKIGQEFQGADLMAKMFFALKERSRTAKEVFENFAENIDKENWFEDEENRNIISSIRYENSSEPSNGLLITASKNNTYTLRSYRDGKLVKTKNEVSFQNVRTEAKKMEHDLYND